MKTELEAVAEYAVDQAKMQIRMAVSTIEVWGKELDPVKTVPEIISEILESRDK